MSTPFTMPPTGFGPGSQPLDNGDAALAYMPLPQDMRIYSPRLPEVDGSLDLLKPALHLLRDVAGACSVVAASGQAVRFDLTGLDNDNRDLVAETLSEGEVAAKVRSIPAVAVQESVFAGVWQLKAEGIDCIEVATIPECVMENAFFPRRAPLFDKAPTRAGVVNAPPLLVELQDKSAAFDPHAELHVVNLSLLPHTEEDLEWLDQALGEGSVTILSRGYGNCRVTATGLDHVWRVQFFNSQDNLILDTFEVTNIPEVACAAPEDLTDSAQRLKAVLEAIQ